MGNSVWLVWYSPGNEEHLEGIFENEELAKNYVGNDGRHPGLFNIEAWNIVRA